MERIYEDLWRTRAEQPIAEAPELVTRAYLIVRPGGNILLYSTGHADELDHMEELGGVSRQYLSHVDEAGPALARIRSRFGAQLCAHRLEAEAVRDQAGVAPDVTFERRETHPNGLEVVPTPGHTVGSVCYLYRSPHGRTYLFTGDTMGRGDDGAWENGYLRGMSDKAQLIESLRLLAGLAPDVVVSSAWGARFPHNEVSPETWARAIEEALAPLAA